VEVAIPLIEDESSLNAEKPEPPTPRAPAHNHSRSKPSVSRPAPQPIDLPTRSDIAVDVASSSLGESDLLPGNDDGDLERGNRLQLRDLQSRGTRPDGVTPDGAMFSPRMSAEDTRLLKRISVEPPTPVTTNPEGELVTLPHKRRSPSPAEDLLNDEPPAPHSKIPSSKTDKAGRTQSSKSNGPPKGDPLSSGSEAVATTTNGTAVTAEASA
jgi:hypothetical protein